MKWVFLFNGFAPYGSYYTRSLLEYDTEEQAREDFERIARYFFGEWDIQDGWYFLKDSRVGEHAFGRIVQSDDLRGWNIL